MDEMKTVQISAPMNANQSTQSDFEIHHLRPSERIALAAKTLALWWSAAVLFILVPVLHFILVPLALLLGIVLSYRRFTFSCRFKGGEALCPLCKNRFALDKTPFNWPYRTVCPECQGRLIFRTV